MSQYKLTDHQYMIRFTHTTNMEEVDEGENSIRFEKFRFRGHPELLQLADKNEDLPDVIGFLCNFNKAENYGEKKSKRVVLSICLEENIRTRLTIWDDLADSIEKKLEDINEQIIIIVGTSLIPKKFGGKLCLSTSSATKLYLNADFDSVRDFRGRMRIQPQFDHSYKKLRANNSGTQLHSITEMLHFISNEQQQDKEFTCKAKVTEIILRNGWSYISCSNCSRKMEKTQDTLSCKNCHDPHVVGILRFRIEVVVDDGSGSTTFVIFDRDAKKITRTTAPTLITEERQGTSNFEQDQVPASILNIVGNTFKFRVKVTPYNFNTKYQSFTVSHIIDENIPDETEKSQLKKNLGTEETQRSKSTTPKIKIEDSRNEDHDNSIVKRPRLKKKKAIQQHSEDSD